ncbi:MAG: serine/threonine-protein phosphatase [Clostridiales bacterium]|jgi:protein phosphatase|nr:serine/threonine-protein phosphatase [Clostridiales bacterium]
MIENNIFTASMKSIIGTRNEQQDACFLHIEGGELFALVCDGMGGLRGGKAASLIASERMKKLFFSKSPETPYPDFFLSAVDILDECVFHLKSTEGESLAAGTTITAVAADGNKLYWLSVGDSRLYIIRGNEIARATRDHNIHLALKNKSSESGIRCSHASRGDALISFIGIGGIQLMDINKTAFLMMPKDKILLTTDGLFKILSDIEILECMKGNTPVDALEALFCNIANKPLESQDNTTCVSFMFSP